jgi:hypothetical protein
MPRARRRPPVLGGERHRGRCLGRSPGAGGDRGFGRQRVVAGLAVDVVRHPLAHAAHRKAGRDDLAAGALRNPLVPGGFEKLQESPVVQLAHRLHVEAAGRDDVVEARSLSRRSTYSIRDGRSNGVTNSPCHSSACGKCCRCSSLKTTLTMVLLMPLRGAHSGTFGRGKASRSAGIPAGALFSGEPLPGNCLPSVARANGGAPT